MVPAQLRRVACDHQYRTYGFIFRVGPPVLLVTGLWSIYDERVGACGAMTSWVSRYQ
jgi:hypothetical protein